MQNSNSEFKVLKRNTIIIAIANIGSKAIAFILAPLYSYFLTTEQYGTMDLITTACGLILPIICLDIYEAVFRFSSDEHYSKDVIISTFLSLIGVETAIILTALIPCWIYGTAPIHVVIAILYAELDSYYHVVSQYVRGCNRMKPFAFSGIINSIVLLLCNIVFMVLLRLELEGWVISFFLGKIVACIYITCIAKVGKHFSLKHVSKEFLKETFKYCIPLLPNAIMWWVMNLSDRFLIALYLGVAANGIYAVASKVPSILSMFENIFFQSWQTSAINTINSSERDKFISSVFEKYMVVLTLGVVYVLTALQPVINIFSDEYHSAWQSSGILVIAIMIHALGGNLGAIYAALKRTPYALYTSLAGAATNILLNVLLIPKWGLIAAALTTLAGYFVVLIGRFVHLRKFIKINFNAKNTIICSTAIVLQLFAYYLGTNLKYIAMLAICGVCTFVYRDTILKLIKR